MFRLWDYHPCHFFNCCFCPLFPFFWILCSHFTWSCCLSSLGIILILSQKTFLVMLEFIICILKESKYIFKYTLTSCVVQLSYKRVVPNLVPYDIVITHSRYPYVIITHYSVIYIAESYHLDQLRIKNIFFVFFSLIFIAESLAEDWWILSVFIFLRKLLFILHFWKIISLYMNSRLVLCYYIFF